MSIEIAKAKLGKGEMLTPQEQGELFSALEKDFEKLKQENPQKYLELSTSMTKIIADLNKELRDAKAELG